MKYENEPALNALIEYLAEKNAAVYVKRNHKGKRLLHYTTEKYVNGIKREVHVIVSDASDEEYRPMLRVYEPENKKKTVLRTVQQFIGLSGNNIPTIEETPE